MIHTSTLPSGLRVLSVPMPSAQTASILIMVRGGSRYETLPVAGISHFMEHLFFKGGEKYKTAQDVALAIDAVGGEFNAFTGHEKVAYYVKVAAEHLPVAIDVLADMLLRARVPEEEVERERNVVYEEINLYEDMPPRRIWDYAQSALFGKEHPLGRDIAGTKESLAGIHRDELMTFRSTYYRPENMLVVGAGKVDPAAFAAAVGAAFGALAGDPGRAAFEPYATWPEERLFLATKETEQAQIALCVPAPKLGSAEEDATEIANAILGRGMSSRLFTTVREQLGLCYSIRSDYSAFEDVGSVFAVAGVTLEKVDDAVRAIHAELGRIHAAGVTEEEFVKGREFVKGQLALGLENTAEMAEMVGHRALLTTAFTDETELIARYDRVTFDAVRAACTIFDPARAVLAVLGPYTDAARFRALLS